MDNGHIINDGPPEFVVVERDGDQALWIRVGPVFSEEGQEPEPGVWIYYQEHHMHSELQGPVLLTKELWREANSLVEDMLEGRT